jgi:hypothetical protein
VYRLIPQHINIFRIIHWSGRVNTHTHATCLSFRCLGLCILSNANVHKLYCVSLSAHSLPKWTQSWVANSIFMFFIYLSFTVSFFLQTFILKMVCTNCLV